MSSDGLERCREILQGLSEGRMLADRERREPEAAAGDEVGFASQTFRRASRRGSPARGAMHVGESFAELFNLVTTG
jgi:hypothetical protein